MNAKDNPFASERVTALSFVCSGETGHDALWEQLEALGWRGAIVGPCGTGKTTLLEGTQRTLAARGFEAKLWRLDRQERRLSRDFWECSFGSNDALLVDGVEQLAAWEWLRLRRHARGAGAFVVTSHRANSLPVWLRTTTSPTLLQQLVRDLGERLSDDAAHALWRRHNGNLRLALWQLYDEYTQRDDYEASL